MLYQVGALQFTGTGINTHEVERETSEDYAEKDVVGALKPAEHTGDGDDIVRLKCRLYTRDQPMGLRAIGMVDTMRRSGVPHICVRGDGTNMGWRRLTNVRESNRFLDRSGVGKVIEYELTLKLSPKPSPAGMLTALYQIAAQGLSSLFGAVIGGR